MNNAKRENLIIIPVLIGFIIEFLCGWLDSIGHLYSTLLTVDTQFKMGVFVLSFFLYYAVVPKSKRLLAFMLMLFLSCTINVMFLFNQSLDVYNLLIYINFDSLFNFNLIYRCIEVFIVTYWLTGIKQNVNSILNIVSDNVNSISNSDKGRTS